MLDIREHVSVIASFGNRTRLRPIRFMWSGRQIEVKEVTYEWTTLEGKSRLIHFSVTDGNTLYQLSFDTAAVKWRLEGVETEV